MDNAGQPLHPLAAIADHYYVVARDLQAEAGRLIEIATFLAKQADWFCEQASRETKHD